MRSSGGIILILIGEIIVVKWCLSLAILMPGARHCLCGAAFVLYLFYLLLIVVKAKNM